MSQEGHSLDKKSLRAVIGKNPRWDDLACDCVAFANTSGGSIHIGIEDDTDSPPPGQQIPSNLLNTIRKQITCRTTNVTLLLELIETSTNSQYVELKIPPSIGVASTTNGRYYVRVGDQNKPVTGDDILRLVTDKPNVPWELQTNLHINRNNIDLAKCRKLIRTLQASDRVKSSVKEKSQNELLDHYQFANGSYLTNLGILCLGKQQDRAKLGTAPVIQFIKFNEHREKVNKLVWDDQTANPIELIETVWQEIPDFREKYELPDGLYRQYIPAFDEVVIRELLVNAVVHRPYTQRGDIFLNLYPDRLEIINPGQLPIGVTPKNILHKTVRRNENLAKLFHDIKLMEREGTGFDMIYEILLSQGRPPPELTEENDSVRVTVHRRIIKPKIIDFIAKADQIYQFSQRERITLGLLAQYDSLTARELIDLIELPSIEELHSWITRLLDYEIVKTAGRGRATRYFIEPALLKSLDFPNETTLKRIEPHRLAALIMEDVRRYPKSKIKDIHQRVGAEIPRSRVRRTLADLVKTQNLRMEGTRSAACYSIHPNLAQK